MNWLKKLFEPKEQKKLYTKEDLKVFENKIITEEDVDKIIEIVKDCDQYIVDNLTDYTGKIDYIKKITFKDAILTFGYLNYTNNLKSDYYGEHSYHSAYFKCCKDYNEDPHNIGSAYFELKMVRIHTIGWDLARKLNIKCDKKYIFNYNDKLNF